MTASSSDAASRADLASLLQTLAFEPVAQLDVVGTAVYLLDGGEARWTCDAGFRTAQARQAIRALSFQVGVGRVGEALAAGQPWRASEAPAGRDAREVDGEGLHLIAAVPLVDQQTQVRGVLCLFGRGRCTVAQHDLAFLSALARSAALIVENVQLVGRLAEQEESHRFLLDRLPDVIWAAGADRIFTHVSAGSEQILGYRPDELIGRDSEIVMHESSLVAFEDGYRWQIAHPDSDQTYRVNLRHKDGHAVPVELHNIGTPVNGRYGGGTGSVREISERLRLEREIEEQAAELAASHERAHLAQELHDSVTQALFTMTITAGTARMMLEQQRPGVESKLEELSTLAREALVEMRSLLFELRPGNVAEEGLLPALRKHAAAVQARTGLSIHLIADARLGPLPLAQEEVLYRIAKEAIHNTVKHAHARAVDVRVAGKTAGVSIEIRDDGIGFDPEVRGEGLGLLGMAARAERLGGHVHVQSRLGGGTRVRVLLPVPPARQAGSVAGHHEDP